MAASYMHLACMFISAKLLSLYSYVAVHSVPFYTCRYDDNEFLSSICPANKRGHVIIIASYNNNGGA